MAVECIVDEVRIRNYQLFISLRDIGSFYVKWNHTFPTSILTSEKLEKYIKELPEKFPEYSIRPSKKVFNIIQIDAPIEAREVLPKEFIRAHYVPLARWKVGVPGSNASVDDRLFEALGDKRNIEQKIEELEEIIENELKDKYQKGQITRHKNKLEGIFTAYDGTNFSDIEQAARSDPATKKLSSEVISRKREISDLIISLNEKMQGLGGRAEQNFHENTIDVTVDSTKYFQIGKPLSAKGLLRQKWCFIDIEKPRFDTDDEEISWAGLCYWQNGEITGRRQYSLRKTGCQSIKNFQMAEGITSPETLVSMVADDIRKENPFIMAVFNAPFDLIQLRKEGEFDIGARGSDPKKDVSIKFMERINVHSRQVFDLFRWSQAAFKYLPNQKLQMIAKHLLGQDRFSKIIDYDDMRELENIAITGTRKMTPRVAEIMKDFFKQEIDEIKETNLAAAQIIAAYLAEDVEILPKILFGTDEGRKSIEDYAFMGDHFITELTRVVHSPNAVNSLQDKIYFEQAGYSEIKFSRSPSQEGKESKKALSILIKLLRNCWA